MFKFLNDVENEMLYSALCYIVLICIFFLADISMWYSLAIIAVFIAYEYVTAYYIFDFFCKEFDLTPTKISDAYERRNRKNSFKK